MTRRVCGALLICALSVAAGAQSPASVSALNRDPKVKGALERIRSSESRTIDDQIRFCEIAAPPFAEKARGEALRAAFAEVGLQNIRVDRVGNVLGDRVGLAARPHLVVAAHLDTVFPEGTAVAVKQQGLVLRGPGIGDNCRGLAVLVAIARAMKESDLRTAGTVTLVANVGEEGLGDLRGVKALFDETLKGQVDRFVSIDNAGLLISTVGVGSHRYRFTFKGPGGHSFAQFGVPNPANALGRAAAVIANFEVPREPFTTFNIGRIGGGTSVNAIPEEAWMEVDIRSASRQALSDLDARLQRAVDSAARDENARWKVSGVITVVKDRVGDRPASSVAANAPIVQVARAVAQELGLSPSGGDASSDANYPMSLGIPAITIGGGGESSASHTLAESFDATDSWKGTQNALLLTLALAQ